MSVLSSGGGAVKIHEFDILMHSFSAALGTAAAYFTLNGRFLDHVFTQTRAFRVILADQSGHSMCNWQRC